MTEPFDVRSRLAEIDSLHAPTFDGLRGLVESRRAAAAAAGSEMAAAISAAEQQASSAEEDYNEFLGQWQDALNSAKASYEAVTPPESAAGQIADITDLDPPPVITAPALASNDTADIQAALDQMAAGLQAALDDLVTQINERLSNIRATATALDDGLTNGSVPGLKAAGESVRQASQLQRDFTPVPIDVESEKADKYSVIDSLL